MTEESTPPDIATTTATRSVKAKVKNEIAYHGCLLKERFHEHIYEMEVNNIGEGGGRKV